MIIGAHTIIYSNDAEADRAFLRDVLGFPNVDVGGGWLIFGLPASEVAVHPAESNDLSEFYLMTDDIKALVVEMESRDIKCTTVDELSWGLLTKVTLPGGGNLRIYQPLHERPDSGN